MAGRTRTNLAAPVVYDDFQPQLERKEEQGANVVQIHLPGFVKEHISVTYVESTRTIKVQGERPLDRNRRSRFNQSFPVPENSIIEKVQGSFRNGILTITIPKKTFTPVTPVKDAKTTKEPLPSEAISQQKPTKDKKEPTPPKAASTSTSGFAKQRDEKPPSPQAPTPQKPIPEPKTPKGPQTASPKPTPTPTPTLTAPSPTPITPGERVKPANGNKVDALQPPKQQEETQKKVAPTATTAKQTEEKTESVEKKAESKDGLENLVKEKEKKDSPASESNIPKTSEKEKKDEKDSGVVQGTKADKEGGGFMAKAKEIRGMETIMKAVKRLKSDDYEDRQLLLNIGVSVLVIVALGAYITYTYRSSGKAEE